MPELCPKHCCEGHPPVCDPECCGVKRKLKDDMDSMLSDSSDSYDSLPVEDQLVSTPRQ